MKTSPDTEGRGVRVRRVDNDRIGVTFGETEYVLGLEGARQLGLGILEIHENMMEVGDAE